MHLTNVSLNKGWVCARGVKSRAHLSVGHPNFKQNLDAKEDDYGTVWSLKAIKRRLKADGIDVEEVFEVAIVVCSLWGKGGKYSHTLLFVLATAGHQGRARQGSHLRGGQDHRGAQVAHEIR